MAVVFAFVTLSSLLIAVGVNLVVELNGALDRLFSSAKVPHFVQMHTGAVDEQRINRWATETGMVEETQISRMISIDGRSLTFSSSEVSEEESVMDLSIVGQNPFFDFLLDRDNRIARPESGEIGVPVYYAERRDVKIGDMVELSADGFSRSFTVSALIRDAQMNPAIVHSKRFLVSENDYRELKDHFPESEYLIEFRLSDPDMVGDFAEAYQAADLPDLGPAVDYRLFRMLNALSDGMVAAVVIMLSLLLMIIALLCLRFTILAAMEEDYREIGIMKAVGMNRWHIRRISLVKYAVLSLLAGLSGYFLSLTVNRLLGRGIGFEPGFSAAPFLAVCFMTLIIMMSARIILGRFDSIGAVEALNAGNRTEAPARGRSFSISRNHRLNLNIFLGIRDVLQRFRLFGLLLFVFFFSVFITVMPLHFLSTLKSPNFISYMGIGQSDIRIDLRQSDGIEDRFDEMVSRIAADKDVARFSPYLTSRFTLVESDGLTEKIVVETGDFSLFPLDYIHGGAPSGESEIALSYLNSRDMDKGIGDSIVLRIDGNDRKMIVSGIYQDVTNGGRTAKASFSALGGDVLWYTLSLDLVSTDLLEIKKKEYAEVFDPARVTDLEGYLSQTLGHTILRLEQVTYAAVALGLCIAMLITSLFLRMLISKDSGRIAVMRSLGFSLSALRLQYTVMVLVLLGLGIITGTLVTNTLGQRLIGAVVSLMGAARIHFVVNPLTSYVLLPLLLAVSVSSAALLSARSIKEHDIAAKIAA